MIYNLIRTHVEPLFLVRTDTRSLRWSISAVKSVHHGLIIVLSTFTVARHQIANLPVLLSSTCVVYLFVRSFPSICLRKFIAIPFANNRPQATPVSIDRKGGMRQDDDAWAQHQFCWVNTERERNVLQFEKRLHFWSFKSNRCGIFISSNIQTTKLTLVISQLKTTTTDDISNKKQETVDGEQQEMQMTVVNSTDKSSSQTIVPQCAIRIRKGEER